MLLFLAETTRYLSPLVAPTPPTDTDVGGYLQWAFQTGVIMAGVLAGCFLVLHGFRYMLTDKITDKSALRKKMYNVIIGLVLAVATYAILNAINPNLLRLDVFKSFNAGDKVGGPKDPSLK
jgi:hypothetical protein